MSNRSYQYFQWPYINSGNNKINFYASPGVRTEETQHAYCFNLLNFKNTSSGYNTEPDPNTYNSYGNRNFTYKVPRSGTYIITGSIPFSFWGNDERRGGGDNFPPINSYVGFKPVGIIQKTTTPNDENSWFLPTNLVGVTTLNAKNSTWGVASYSNLNLIRYASKNSDYALYTLDIQTSVTLIAGEYVRFQFYLIDISNIFGNSANGSREFEFYINGTPPNSSLGKGFFEIYDSSTPITLYNFTSSYGQIPSFFTASSVNNNTLIFNQSASYLFTTASTFVPTTITQNYYSPVVDYFGIQKYDLIRIGGFNSPNTSYYEVQNVSSSATNIYVTLDRTIESGSYNNALNFAILRPNPDETSVIVNFKKQPGEVSQTILVPYDANDTIKNSIGNIFKTINPDV